MAKPTKTSKIKAEHVETMKTIVKDSLNNKGLRKKLLGTSSDVAINHIKTMYKEAGEALVAAFPKLRFRQIRAGQAYIIGPDQEKDSMTIFLPLDHVTSETAVCGTGFPEGSTPETTGCPPN